MQNKNKIVFSLIVLAACGMIGIFLFDFSNARAESDSISENVAKGEFIPHLSKNSPAPSRGDASLFGFSKKPNASQKGAGFIVRLNINWNRSEENIGKIKNFLKKFQISLDSLNDGKSETLKNRLLVKLADAKKSEAFFKAAKEFFLIESISPNYIYRPFFTPSDPLYSKQWNFEKMKIPQAWDEDQAEPLYGGDPSVIVAIIDTGVAYETYGAFVQAPDLAGTTFVPGYDFVENDDHPNDADGHGTHIAGTIAQTTNNGVGSAGIVFNAKIMPLRVCSDICLSSAIAQAVLFAKNNGAKVINMSLGGDGDDPVLHSAIQEARSAGIVIAAGVGNGGDDGIGDGSISYPAAYEETIAVGAVRYDNSRVQYSNYGTGLDIMAPGGDSSVDQNGDGSPDGILQQTFPNACYVGGATSTTTFDYLFCQGTSMATPHLSGVAALLISAGYSGADVPQIIYNAAADLGAAGYDTEYGYGLIDAKQAIQTAISGTLIINRQTFDPNSQIVDLIITAFGARGSVEMSFSNNNADWSPWETFAATKNWNTSDPIYGGSESSGGKLIYARLRDSAGRVSSSMSASTSIDAVAPTITLKGQNPERVILGSVYVDAGASALDNIDGDISANIAVSNTVNTTARGSYEVKYSIADSAGNAAEAVRTIYVVEPIIATGPKIGGPQVRVFAPDGKLISQFMAFDKKKDTMGINVAIGDLDGDYNPEIIVSKRMGGDSRVKVFDLSGKDLKLDFLAFSAKFKGGVSLVAADLEGDGRDEILAVPQNSGSAQVRIFGFRGSKIELINPGFYSYEKDFKGGSSLAAGDTDGDGVKEIIAAPLSEKSPEIKIFALQNKKYILKTSGLLAYSSKFKGGVELGTGDVDADGKDEIVVAPASNGGPQVRLFKLSGGKGSILNQFFAFNKKLRIGISLSSADIDGNGSDDIVAGIGDGGSNVRMLDQKAKRIADEFHSYSLGFKSGITIAAGYRK